MIKTFQELDKYNEDNKLIKIFQKQNKKFRQVKPKYLAKYDLSRVPSVASLHDTKDNLIIDDNQDIISVDDDVISDHKSYPETKSVADTLTVSDCPSCYLSRSITDSVRIDQHNGNMVCVKCGDVVDKVLDQTIESTKHEDSSNHISRFEGPMNFYLPNSSAAGQNIMKNRLRTQHNWINMPYEERSRLKVLIFIQERCNSNKLQKCIIEAAKNYYTHVDMLKNKKDKDDDDLDPVRGGNLRGLPAACVKIACLEYKVVRTDNEIADLFEVKPSELGNAFDTVTKILKKINNKITVTSNTPLDYIKRYGAELNTKPKVVKLAKKVANNINLLNIASNHMPTSIAVACLCISLEKNKIKISKSKLAKLFKISEVTITKTLGEIRDCTDIIISNTATKRALKILKQENGNE